ncbi:unnamed protein product [Peniophora sp. CBMAI 1063]|nr:unnamed protein product [Peniophora sp. CBMAI 1063]
MSTAPQPIDTQQIWLRSPEGFTYLVDSNHSNPPPTGGGHRLRDAARRFVSAMPGRRTRPRSDDSTPSSPEPSTPLLHDPNQPFVLPPNYPIHSNLFAGLVAPMPPSLDPQAPPPWAHQAPPQMQMPTPSVRVGDDVAFGQILPQQGAVQSRPKRRTARRTHEHIRLPGRDRQDLIDPRFARDAGRADISQSIDAEQHAGNGENAALEPLLINDTSGRERGADSASAIPGNSSSMGGSRPSVPERASTVYSFPTISTGLVPKRQSVDSRRTLSFPPMSSRFSTNTSVLELLDGERSRSHSLEDTVSVPATEDLQRPGGSNKRRSREERSQLRVSFSSELSELAPSTVHTASTDDTSPSTLGRPLPSVIGLPVSEEERAMIFQNRLRRELNVLLGIPDDIAHFDPQGANDRVLDAVRKMKFEKREAEEAVWRLERKIEGIQALVR